VRLLEHSLSSESINVASSQNKPVAGYAPPLTEGIRFHGFQSLSFPASEIQKITIKQNDEKQIQWQMHVNFMGLTGSTPVLPYHYTEFVLKRLKQKDSTIMDFLDLFNHRSISLFYHASIKYSLPISYERKLNFPVSQGETDNHTQILLSLIGLGTKGLQDRLYTRDESLIFYAGLLTNKLKTVSGLKQIIYNHFSIEISINEFVGQWQELIEDVRTRLPSLDSPRGQNNQLGKTLMLGRRGWFSQGKIRIILGPLSKKQLRTFAPGTDAFKALDEIVRFYINFEHDYDYVMRIRHSDIPDKIVLSKINPPVMGWNTWLATSSEKFVEPTTTVDIPVSAQRLQH